MNDQVCLIYDFDGTILDDIFIAKDIPKYLAKEFKVNIDNDDLNLISEEFFERLSTAGKLYEKIKVIWDLGTKFRVSLINKIKMILRTEPLAIELMKKSEFIDKNGSSIDYLVEKYDIIPSIITTTTLNDLKNRLGDRLTYLDRFNGIITGSDVKKLKPDPEAIYKLSNQLQIDKNNMAIIDDTPSDIKAGKNAKIVTVGVLTGFADKTILNREEPDFIIKDITEIPDIFEDILHKIKN